MLRRSWFGVLLLLVLLHACTVHTAAPLPGPANAASALTTTPSVADLLRAIGTANYCTTSSDCTYLGDHSPELCNIYVNKAEAHRISTLLNESPPDPSSHECIPCPTPACLNGHCHYVCH